MPVKRFLKSFKTYISEEEKHAQNWRKSKICTDKLAEIFNNKYSGNDS